MIDIATWLRQLGLERYEAAFRDNEVTADILRDLTRRQSRSRPSVYFMGLSREIHAGSVLGDRFWLEGRCDAKFSAAENHPACTSLDLH